MSKAPN